MARILIIDDDAVHVRSLARTLRRDNHEPHHAGTGAGGVEMARRTPPDLVLIEWSLPDVSGVDVLSQLIADPATRHVPVVFVTARSEEIYRVHAFEMGAADYVVKPFSMRELLLRLRAILRRGAAPGPGSGSGEDRGVLRVDRAGRRVWVEGREITLTRLEHDLLVSLMDVEDRVETRAALLRRAWGNDANVTARTVDTHITRLRNKLGRAAGYVQTVRGLGYRFSPFE